MTKLNDLPLASLQFYATAPYPCSYLAGRAARSQVATPSHLIDTASTASSSGSASGAAARSPIARIATTAAPACPCAYRSRASRPNRTQRRCLQRHAGFDVARRELAFNPEHYALYLRYQRHRHPGGGMDQDSREQYQHFLLQSNVSTDLIEFRERGVLRIVSLVDRLADGLSSVYTFFEPDVAGASYGTFNILWQIERCRALGLAAPLPRLLDRRKPEDGVQGHVPADRGAGGWGVDHADINLTV